MSSQNFIYLHQYEKFAEVAFALFLSYDDFVRIFIMTDCHVLWFMPKIEVEKKSNLVTTA